MAKSYFFTDIADKEGLNFTELESIHSVGVLHLEEPMDSRIVFSLFNRLQWLSIESLLLSLALLQT